MVLVLDDECIVPAGYLAGIIAIVIVRALTPHSPKRNVLMKGT